MKAMILAAGLGQRMHPLTSMRPKPALPVLGRPLLAQTLHRLASAGVDDVVINLHHLPEGIRRIVADAPDSSIPEVRFSLEERELLGTAGGLRHAAGMLTGEGPIVVCNADFVSDVDVSAAVDAHLRGPQIATLVLRSPDPRYSVVECDTTGRVLSLAGEPTANPAEVTSHWMFTGFHVMDEEVFERIPTDGPSDIVAHVYRSLAAEHRLGSFVHEGFWWEFGSPGLYLDGSLKLVGESAELRRRICPDHDRVCRRGDALAAIGAAAVVHDAARLRGRVVLGYASHVGAGAEIEESVVMPEAWIGPGCRIRRCIVDCGVELPADFEARDGVVLADGSVVPIPG